MAYCGTGIGEEMDNNDSNQPSIIITLSDIYLKLCALEKQVQEIDVERWKYALPSNFMLAIVSVAVTIMSIKQ